MRVLEVARTVVDEVNGLAAVVPQLGRDQQLKRSVQSVAANIREAYGRRKGPERNQFLRFARGSAEETDEHLRAHFAQKHLPAANYWRLHNRLMVCVKMMSALLRSETTSSEVGF
jgi:four helix bundle protein